MSYYLMMFTHLTSYFLLNITDQLNYRTDILFCTEMLNVRKIGLHI